MGGGLGDADVGGALGDAVVGEAGCGEPYRRAGDRVGMRARRLVVPAVLVLVVGGCTSPSPSHAPTTEPARVSAQPLRPRAGHSATLLPDGRVLLAGGCAVDGCTTAEVEPSSEFYVPGRGFVAGPPMVHPRSSHTATLLADGRVLIVGGWAKEGTAPLTEAEVFDPATGTFQPAGTLHGGAILLPDDRVLITGGEDERTAIFDPGTNSLAPRPAMPQRRQSASIVLPDGNILITGGQDASVHGLSSTVIYDPRSGASRPGPQMGTPRFKHAITMLDRGRILVLGGTTDDTQLLTSTEILDLATNTFAPGPAMSTPRYKFSDAVAHTTTGRVVIAGGTLVDVLAGDGKSFGAVRAGTGARRWASTATALRDGTVLVVGGYDDGIRLLRDAHIIHAGP